MFNAPRRSNPSLTQSAFFQSSSSNNTNSFDPLAASSPNVGIGVGGGSGFGDVNPWSGMASPARAATPQAAQSSPSAETTPVAPVTMTMPSYSPPVPNTRRESEDVVMPAGMHDGYTRLPGAIKRGGDGLKELIGMSTT